MGRPADVFGKAENIFPINPLVANFIDVTTDQLNTPAARRIILRRWLAFRRLRRVERRTAVTQFNGEYVIDLLECDLKLLSGIALQSVIDNVATALFQCQHKSEQDLLRDTIRPGQLLQYFHGAHHFRGRGVQFECQASPSFPESFGAGPAE
jgi:hypothetical protein